MTQLLPNEDVAMLIWGNKITGDISSPIRFHASKELARKYLTTRRKKKWSQVQFDSVDWEHLDLALKSKERTCIGYGDPNKILAFAERGFRLAATPESPSQTRGAQIAAGKR